MKKLVFNIAILICVIFTSCSDDDSVNIVSFEHFLAQILPAMCGEMYLFLPNSVMIQMLVMNGDAMVEA